VTNGHYLGGWPEPRSDQWSLCGVIGTWERFCNIIGNFVDYLPDLMMFFLCVAVEFERIDPKKLRVGGWKSVPSDPIARRAFIEKYIVQGPASTHVYQIIN